MDNTQDILHALEQRLAAQDIRNAKMDEMMSDFMAKTLRMVQNGPTKDHRYVGSTHTSPLPSQQDQQQRSYEDANFRHQRVARDLSQETTFRNTPDSYFKKRLSSLQSIAEDSIRENTVVRSVANIDIVKSGILLTYLDISHLHKWTQDLMRLQRKHPHNILRWALFITDPMTLRINAYNESKRIIRRTIINGMEIDLPNEELFDLILDITLPKSEQDWIDDFKKLVSFRKLYKNQHESTPDTTRYDAWYEAIMEILYEANEINELLSANKAKNFAPVLKSYNGKPGLMQIFYELIPMGVGKNIHNQITYTHINHEDLTFREYTVRFQEQNQLFQDASDTAKINRAKLNTAEKTGAYSYIKPPTNNIFHNKNNNNSYANNNKNTYDNNKPITPYTNPYHKKLNNIYNDNLYGDDNDEYHEDNYDLDEVYGNRNESIEGLNPGSNVTTYLSSLDREASILPCHAELEGKCETGGKPCRYSHDPQVLQREWKLKMDRLQASKYRTTIKAPATPYTPSYPPQVQKRDTPLRSITAEEEGKVSTPKDTNNNDILYSNNDREGHVAFAEHPDKPKTDSAWKGDSRGQQYL
jgi:hypothetical protein